MDMLILQSEASSEPVVIEGHKLIDPYDHNVGRDYFQRVETCFGWYPGMKWEPMNQIDMRIVLCHSEGDEIGQPVDIGRVQGLFFMKKDLQEMIKSEEEDPSIKSFNVSYFDGDCEQAALLYLFLGRNPAFLKDVYMLEKIHLEKQYDTEKVRTAVFSLIPSYFKSAFDKKLGYIMHVDFQDDQSEPFVELFNHKTLRVDNYTIYYDKVKIPHRR